MPEPRTPLSERPWEDVERLLGVDEALNHILAHAQPLSAVRIPLTDARGLVLAENVVARNNVPPFTNSAMDGFAVQAADTIGATVATPITLRVVGVVAAGEEPNCVVEPGCAVRIMTGAVLPEGADAVVRFEETDEPISGHHSLRAVQILHEAKWHDNIRLAGEDISRGSLAMSSGVELRAAHLGLLASLGWEEVTAHRRPRVGILSTGNEVVASGSRRRAAQIRDSNSVTLHALVEDAGGLPIPLGVVRDDMVALRHSLRGAVVELGVDLLLTSGGVSVGDYDMVKDALRAEGEIAVWQVRIKPGKPLAFGVVGGTPLLGLPGNPVAAAVSFLQFGRPMIRRMSGRRSTELPTVVATLAAPVDNRGHRRHYVRVRLERRGEEYRALPVGEQGAGILSSLAMADGLLVIPEEVSVAEMGMRLPVQVLGDLPAHARRCEARAQDDGPVGR
ncbi:MAG: molybdopterin molybdotransferase MoeA [Chloroflexia bacterium]|nr:molybdopterin molybdotransferase MoeA [Chloroflexia bacterium]